MMKGDILVMSEEERRRCYLLQMALDGRITVKDAGELMGESCRHAKRLRRRYDLDGAWERTSYSAAAFFCGRLE